MVPVVTSGKVKGGIDSNQTSRWEQGIYIVGRQANGKGAEEDL